MHQEMVVHQQVASGITMERVTRKSAQRKPTQET